MARRTWAGLAAAAAACATIEAGAATHAWIAYQDGIAAVDVERLVVVANIARPARDVAALPGVRFVYAVDPFVGALKIDGDALAVVGEHRIDSSSPFAGTTEIELKPGRDEAYARSAGRVHILRTDALGFIGSLDGVFMEAIPAIDRIGGRAYFRGPDSPSTIGEFDLASNRLVRQLPYAPTVMEAHPTLRRLFLVDFGHISVLDLETGTTVANAIEPRLGLVDSARINPAGTRLFVTERPSNVVHVFDAATLALLATISVGTGPRGVDISPDGARVFVVNEGSGDLSVIDVVALTEVARIPIGAMPSSRGRFIGGSTSASSLATGPATGLWWNPAESGWGLHVTQRGSTFFAALFHYDAAGNPRWFVAPNCRPNVECPGCVDGVTCNGAIFETGGPAFFLVPFNSSAVQTREVGLMELRFADRDNAQFTYIIAGNHRSLPIRRQAFAARTALATDYTDLWWNPMESGWGLGITQQSNVMFLTWFVYDSSGAPAWYVASNCVVVASGSGCRGPLYRTSGAFGPVPGSSGFDRSGLRVTEVGTIDVAFEGANNGVITYTVDGRTGTKAITRQLF